MTFLDRMPNARAYPDPTDPSVVDVSSSGWLMTYISSTFLDGWINYVEPVKAYVVHRYHDDARELERAIDAWHSKPGYHTDLGAFGDDVELLCRSERGDYWYFGFDRDVSDCCLGKFSSIDPIDDVLGEFDRHVRAVAERVRSYHGGDAAAFELDVSKMSGWKKF